MTIDHINCFNMITLLVIVDVTGNTYFRVKQLFLFYWRGEDELFSFFKIITVICS
jgi:hypothetical protein